MLDFRDTDSVDVWEVYDGPCRIGILLYADGVGKFSPEPHLTPVTINQLREIADEYDRIGLSRRVKTFIENSDRENGVVTPTRGREMLNRAMNQLYRAARTLQAAAAGGKIEISHPAIVGCDELADEFLSTLRRSKEGTELVRRTNPKLLE